MDTATTLTTIGETNTGRLRPTPRRETGWSRLALPALALALAGAACFAVPAGRAGAEPLADGPRPIVTPVNPIKNNVTLPKIPTVVAARTPIATRTPVETQVPAPPPAPPTIVSPTTPPAATPTKPATVTPSPAPGAPPAATATTAPPTTTATPTKPATTTTATATATASPAASATPRATQPQPISATDPVGQPNPPAGEPALTSSGSAGSTAGTGTGTGTGAAPAAEASPFAVPSPKFDPKICRDDGTSPGGLCEKDGPGSDAGVPGSMVNVIPAGFNGDPAAATTPGPATDATPAAATGDPAATAATAGSTATTRQATLSLDRGTGAGYAAGDALGISYTVPAAMPVEVTLVQADRRLTLYQGPADGAGTLNVIVPQGAGIAVVELKAGALDAEPLTETVWFRVN